jgi:hypothetical protein
MRSATCQALIAVRTPGVFLVALFLCLLGCKRNFRPTRPATVPASAVWVDSVFIECSVETKSQANRCTIYKDGTGEVLESGLFILSGGGREATKAELKYAAFGGHVIYLQDARLLYPVPLPESSTPRPWIFPGDFRERLRMSDLVVSGTIEDTSPIGVQIVDRIELAASTARIRVDRVFQGESIQNLRFKWFTLQCSTSGGFYSGPRPACFQPQKRYLIFLRRDTSGWVVALPLYGIEIQLAPALPSGAFRDLSHASIQRRYEAIAEELEMTASLLPVPLPGSTGEAATYFSEAFDLIGGCAEPFYRSFLSSPSHELRGAALDWLELICSRHMTCKTGVSLRSLPTAIPKITDN